jgi:hypothetical protein
MSTNFFNSGTDTDTANMIWDLFRIYNAVVAGLAVLALFYTRKRWYRQSEFARIAWLALVLYSGATMFSSFAAIHTAAPATPRTAMFTCAVTYCLVVCFMFHKDNQRLKQQYASLASSRPAAPGTAEIRDSQWSTFRSK